MKIVYAVFLGFAVSLDSFLAGATYGIRKISMPFLSLAVVGMITTVCTGLAMLLAKGCSSFFDPNIAVAAGSVLLISIGLFSVFQEYLTRKVTPYDTNPAQKLTIRIGKLIINIMADPEAVDLDHSKTISAGEAVMLGLALGLDNMAATFAAELLGILPTYTPVIMGLIQSCLIWAGIHVGARLLPEGLKQKFPYFPGTLLALMGFIRLVK
ncbi:MAG: sporulation membrane protein YtaF [Negativicutes bacterium]|nr:sporulation membrane protein YtaF [Negativicutes bacterium]